jgi:hypothetical protein
MEARRTSRVAWKLAPLALLAALALALPATAPGGRGRLTLARAERAARQAVRQHPSYRQIGASRTPLVTRSCWRVAVQTARCSLYVVVPNPCALDPRAGIMCAQALWQRRWLVEVKGATAAAQIVRISSEPATPA